MGWVDPRKEQQGMTWQQQQDFTRAPRGPVEGRPHYGIRTSRYKTSMW